MKRIVEKEDVYKKIKKGTREVVTFEASDGRKFSGRGAEASCVQYEEILRLYAIFEGIETVGLSVGNSCLLFNVPDTFYHPVTDEELEQLKIRMGYENRNYKNVEVNDVDIKHKKIFRGIFVGDWIGCVVEDGGDFGDTYHFYTLDYVKETLGSIL